MTWARCPYRAVSWNSVSGGSSIQRSRLAGFLLSDFFRQPSGALTLLAQITAFSRVRRNKRPHDGVSSRLLFQEGCNLGGGRSRLPSVSRPQRAAGARVILDRGVLLGYLNRTGQHLLTFLPETEPERSVAMD
jgi:hypothetical protein